MPARSSDPPPAGPSPRYTVDDFAYECPPDLIAQQPCANRADSRLLVLDRASGRLTHRRFRDFPTLLAPGDLLVRNVSRVIRARLLGTRNNGRPAEVLLVHPEPDGTWLAMVHPGGKLKPGRVVRFGEEASVVIEEVHGGGLRRVRFAGSLDATAVMARHGVVPLPPYIHRAPEPADAERYQTVYAAADGSVAAPTAGLHFTDAVFGSLRERGVTIADVVLHVGPGTFKPVEVDDPARHAMHAEWYEVPPDAAEAIAATRAHGGRIWAVGTTSARVLETAGRAGRGVEAGSGWTDIFIYPPYTFRAVDALLTNFHLPRSTLLMLVAAFAGHTPVMAAYREAVRARYRLYSYGDAMAVV